MCGNKQQTTIYIENYWKYYTEEKDAMCNDRPGYSVNKSENRKQNECVAAMEGRGDRQERKGVGGLGGGGVH